MEPGLVRRDLHRSRVIAELADSQELPYQDYIARYRKRRPRYGRLAGDPIKVARVIHKIARSRRPGFRYSVGPDARLGTLAVRLLPERLFQTLLARATLR